MTEQPAGELSERQRAEAATLRSQLEELVHRARVLLNGESSAGRPPVPAATRGQRDREFEQCLEKVEWHRREIKRLRKEIDARDQAFSKKDAKGRDPTELRNLLVERRRELQQLQRAGEGLERVASAQKRAEAEQNVVKPDLQEKLARIRKEFEMHKRKNIKLQSERLKVSTARKKAEEDVRDANQDARSKAAQLKPQQTRGRSPNTGFGKDSLKQLRQNVDILREAKRQDERKFRIAQREESQEAEFSQQQVAELRELVVHKETEIAKYREHNLRKPPLPDSSRSRQDRASSREASHGPPLSTSLGSPDDDCPAQEST